MIYENLVRHQHVTDPSFMLEAGSVLRNCTFIGGGATYGRFLFRPDPLVVIIGWPPESCLIENCIFVY